MLKRSFLASLPLIVLAGCGGGSSHSGGTASPSALGKATVSIVWPDRSGRFVPLSSNSVVVTLSSGGVQQARQIVARPTGGSTTSTANFTGLAYEAYIVTVDAHPNADGTGNAQATGAASMTVSEDVPGTASVSLATTVTSLSLLPLTLDKKGTATEIVSATDANGATVLLTVGNASETVSWSADPIQNSLGAMVDAVTLSASTGATVTLTGAHSGTTQIHATLGLGLPAPLTASGSVTVNAISDGTGAVIVS